LIFYCRKFTFLFIIEGFVNQRVVLFNQQKVKIHDLIGIKEALTQKLASASLKNDQARETLAALV